MTFKMLLLVFSMLLIVKATLAKIDCDSSPFSQCKRPQFFNEIPTEVSDFNVLCLETKTYLRCANDYQEECGTNRITLFQSPGLFEASYNTISDACEEGTLLNSIATDNLKCFNETFGKTNCRKEAFDVVEPLVNRMREGEEFDYTFSPFCLEETHATDCVLRALSENCGKLVEEAALEFILRSKSLEYACTVEEAKQVSKELGNLDLAIDKKRSVGLLLEKVVELNSD